MSKFIKLEMENDRSLYINLEEVRAVYDHPDEDSVRIEFDDHHKIYLGRDRAVALVKALK